MKFEIENESQVFKWMTSFMILSVDFNSHFVEDLHLPFPYDDSLKQFAIHCVCFYDDLHSSPHIATQMMYRNNLFEQIYKDGQQSLGTEKIEALIKWGDALPFYGEIEHLYGVWLEDLLFPLIKFDNINNDVPISNGANEHLRSILIKSEIRGDVIEVIFEELKRNGASEWDKKVDYIRSARVLFPDSSGAIYGSASVLLFALNNMDAWHEITQTLGTDDLLALQTWMTQRAKALNLNKWETRMDFELVKQHMTYFYPKS